MDIEVEAGNVSPKHIDRHKAQLYSNVFDNPQGRKIIEDLVSITGYFGDTHVAGDPFSTAFNCGQRRILNRILNFVGSQHVDQLAKQHHERIANV